MYTPQFVYKIVAWQPNLEFDKVRLPDLDHQSGFIHLSIAQQVPRVADLFFSSNDELNILKVAYDKIGDNVRWESPPDSDELFPHLYGDLWSRDVESVRTFHKGEGSWNDALHKDLWFEEGGAGGK